MADMMSTLKGLLGDDADGKIQNAMELLKKSGLVDGEKKQDLSSALNKAESEIKVEPQQNPGTTLSPEGLEFISQIKSMVNRLSNTNDNRSELLKSLKPFMRAQRQQTIDRAVKILNIGRFAGILAKK